VYVEGKDVLLVPSPKEKGEEKKRGGGDLCLHRCQRGVVALMRYAVEGRRRRGREGGNDQSPKDGMSLSFKEERA